MSAPELIVPVEVHALLVNERVRTTHPFHRTKPNFGHMLGEGGARGGAEPEAFQGGHDVSKNAAFEGVHVQWELPEALTDGVVDPVTQQTRYPLAPNRWLVARYAQVRGQTTAKGWIVHSDYLYSDDDGARWDGVTENSFLNLRADTPIEDWLGSFYDLTNGPWHEPEPRELFLTAIGAGLPTFAAFQPYHENVFSLHDNLVDLKDREHGDSYPPDATLSYLVTGWYSDPAKDILRTAADIPGLLPPGSDGSIADIIQALGWTTAPPPIATCTIPGHGDNSPPASGPVDRILDGRDDTWFQTGAAPTASDSITVDLGVLHHVTAITATFGEVPAGGRMAPAKTLRVSADGTDWTDVGSATRTEPVFAWHTDAPLPARYIRIQFDSASAYTTVVRNLSYSAVPVADWIERSLYSGTALGLDWHRGGPAPDDDRPGGNPPKIALGHSTGEAAEALAHRQTRSAHTAGLFSALYHGTLDTFEGPDGEQDLTETTHRSWFSGSEGGTLWTIRPKADTDGQQRARDSDELNPGWLIQLNADQRAFDTAQAELDGLQWRLWSVYWLRNLPARQRPDLPADFDQRADQLLDPGNANGIAAETQAKIDEVADLAAGLPRIPAEAADPQDAIDEFAGRHHLASHLQLARTPADSFYRPADPVLLIEGSAGATRPLTRDEDDPLRCRTPETLLRRALIDGEWAAPPDDPPRPDITGLPGPVSALISELTLLDQAARTRTADGGTALAAIIANPETHAEGALAEYTRPWRQAWLPMTLMWKLSYFPTPYRTGTGDYHWTFQPPDPGTPSSHHYTWNGTGAPPADFESEGDRLNRLFRSRSYLAPTIAYVARAQLRRYLATHVTDAADGLTRLSEDFESLDVLSQSLDGFNDWLLQLDGSAQVPTEPAVADLTAEQGYVPDGAGGPLTRRFDAVRAGQFFFTDLRIVDRFGRVLDIVTSGEGGNWYDQYPVRASSVTPNRPLYGEGGNEPDLINPERFIQLPPRLLQDTRLAFTPRPGPTARGLGSPVVGWLLVNYLDATLGMYGPAGEALGELRVITQPDDTRATQYNPLPHSGYTGRDDPRFTGDHPELAAFLDALLGHPPEAFDALVETIDAKLTTSIDPVPTDDHLPSRLIGQPCALIRTDLDLQLRGPALTDPSWAAILDPPDAAYPSYTWPIRLGSPYGLTDGLIGYFASSPGEKIAYGVLRAVEPAGQSTYIEEIGNGDDLALPARPSATPVTRHLTLLANPHLPIHATTDILPVHAFQLDAGLVHEALAAIRASFRLNPLLAPGRPADATGTGTATDAVVLPPLSTRYGTWSWAQPRVTGTGEPAWDELPLLPADQLTHPDDPIPSARAGYLQLNPAAGPPAPEPEP